ncbi:MAG TPA: hypothetical protein VFO69_13890 [Allosphingosinicella sp.]|nr:hypothetical protein [Allosphingosinicella sp.]
MFLATLALASQATEWTDDQRQLAQQLTQETRDYRAGLPLRDGVLTITEVQLRGLEIVYTGIVDGDWGAENIGLFRDAVTNGLCAGDTSQVIRRGGSFTYDLRDVSGERFVTTVAHCK